MPALHGICEMALFHAIRNLVAEERTTRFLSHDDIKTVVAFIQNFAEDHTIVLHGRIPGFKNVGMKLLPSSMTKCSIVQLYHTAMELSVK